MLVLLGPVSGRRAWGVQLDMATWGVMAVRDPLCCGGVFPCCLALRLEPTEVHELVGHVPVVVHLRVLVVDLLDPVLELRVVVVSGVPLALVVVS